jgi:hypothetical protein
MEVQNTETVEDQPAPEERDGRSPDQVRNVTPHDLRDANRHNYERPKTPELPVQQAKVAQQECQAQRDYDATRHQRFESHWRPLRRLP